jgi:hypothetical protein
MPTLYEADKLNRAHNTEVGRPINPIDNPEYMSAVGVSEAAPLSDDDYAVYLANKDWVTKAEQALEDGSGSQEQLDEAVAATYTDPVKHLAGSNREYTESLEQQAIKEDEYDGSYIAARKVLFEKNPELKMEFDRAARHAGLSYNAIPEKSSGFWDNVNLSYQQYASMANTTDIEVLNGVRQMTNQTYTVPEAVLTDDIPEMYHATLIQEQLKYGDAAAMLKKEQLQSDINNNRILEDMPWYAQLGYGVLGLAIDPLTWATGGVTAEVGAAVKAGTVLSARKLAPSGIKASQSLPVKAAAAMADWVTMAGAESALINGTRLAGGDHTYTLAQYKVDIMADAVLGGVFGTAINVGGAVRKTQQLAHQAKVDEAVASMERMKQQASGDKSTVDDRTTIGKISPFTITPPDYTYRWTPAPTDKVSNWLKPDEMTVLSKSDQVALARYRKNNSQKVAPELPDVTVRTAGIAANQLQVNPQEPRMTLSAMTELNERHGIEDFVTNELNKKMQEGYVIWKPANNEQKHLGNAVIDTVTKLNASMHIVRRMTQAIDQADTRFMTDDLRADVAALDMNIQRMTNAWQWTRPLSNDQYADMVLGLNHVLQKADTMIKQIDAGDYVKRQDADGPIGLSRDTDEYSDVVDIDFQSIITEVVDDPLAPAILDKYADNMKDIPIAFAKVQMERSQAVADNIRRVVNGDAPTYTDPLLQDITGITQGQFNAARATILNSPLGKDPSFNTSEYKALLGDVSNMFKSAVTDADVQKAQSLALDVVELGVLYRNGLPKEVKRGLSQLKYKKDVVFVNNAFTNLLRGGGDTQTELADYVDSLRGFFKEDVAPASREELRTYFRLGDDVSEEFAEANRKIDDVYEDVDIPSGPMDSTSVKHYQPADLYVLNTELEGYSYEVGQLLQELNGMMIAAAQRRKETGALTRVAKFKAVKNTGDDIMAHMRAEGLTPGTPEYKARFKELRNQNHVAFQKGNSELQAELNEVGDLKYDDTGDTLLPQSYSITKTVHDKAKYMENAQKTVRGMLQQAGVNNRHWQPKSSAKKQVQRISAIKRQLRESTNAVVAKMIASGDMIHLVDVIRASKSLNKDRAARRAYRERKLNEAKLMQQQAEMREAQVAKELQQEVVAARGPLPLDELEVAITNKTAELKGVTSTQELTKLKGELGNMMELRERMRVGEIPAVDMVKLQNEINELTHDIPDIERMNTMQRAMTAEEVNRLSVHKIITGLDTYANGEVHVDTASVAPRDWVASMGAVAGRAMGLTKEFSEVFRMDKSIAMKYIGFRLTESGRGNAGSVQRKHTAAIIKEAEYTKSISQILPAYAEAMDAYAVSQGRNAVGKLTAKTMAGADSQIVNEFNRAFFKYQNDMKLGRPPVTNPVIQKFVKEWDDYMNYNHGRLTEQGVAGFTIDRKLAHYVPQVWKVGTLRGIYERQPQDVLALFAKGYRAAGHESPVELAEQQINHLLGMGETVDQFLPSADARSKTQLKIDQSVEHNGLTMLDLLDIEVAGVATKYSNRVGGWVSINKATDGMLNNGVDLTNMRNIIEQETKSVEAVRDFDDLIDMLMGRPTRDGLPAWLRSVKDLTVLTRMGGLGTAQAIETGSVLTRGLLEAAGDPEFLKRVMKGISDEDAPAELQELMRLTGYNKDYEWLNRQSVYLDQRQFSELSKTQEMSNTIVDKATGGSLKAPASRLLSQVSGYNAVRKYQSMIMQRSFGMAVARHFKFGSSKIPPRRLADIGLTDSRGFNSDLQRAINEHVVFDAEGYPVKYNFDKWDRKTLEVFQYSMQRAESQDIIRASIGELPRWMNMPLMQVITQFRTIPILSNNKALARSMAFGDREAVVGLALNVMSAGLVRAAKVALLAGGYSVIKGTEFSDEYETKWGDYSRDSLAGGAIDKYITQVGIYPEISSLAVIGNQTWQNIQDAENNKEGAKLAANAVFGQIPALSLLRDGYKTGEAVTEGDFDTAVKEVQGVTMLGNTAMMEMIFTALEENMKGE